MMNTPPVYVPVKVQSALRALVVLALLFISTSSSYAVTCITLNPDPNNPNHPDNLQEAPESVFQDPVTGGQYTERQIPGPTINAKTTERAVFMDYTGAGVPGGYYGAILSDGQTAKAYKATPSKPVKSIIFEKSITSLDSVTKNKPPHLRVTFKQGHFVNSYVGGNPQKAMGYTILTSIANPNHEAAVESFMVEVNRLFLKHYFHETTYDATANNFVARGPNEQGQIVEYSPAYYYEMIVNTDQTVWDMRTSLMPSWQQMGFKKKDLKKLPAYYDITIRFVMGEYANGQPTGDVYNMPAHVFDQFRNDTGINLPDFSTMPGSYMHDGYHFRANNPVVGTRVNLGNQEVHFRLYNYGK